MDSSSNSHFYCSQLSQKSNEQIFGTASVIKTWFLLEFKPWPTNGLSETNLSEQVKSRLTTVLKNNPLSTLLFIKKRVRKKKNYSFYVILTKESQSITYHFELDKYEDILSINISDILKGNSPMKPLKTPLYLICTDGKKDKCCAKFGIPIYKEAVRISKGIVWQSSHIGGDRFAANLVCLPDGLYYGHVNKSEVNDIICSYEKKRVYLDKYRGRSLYKFITQAGEYFLRNELGVTDIYAFKLSQATTLSKDLWNIDFLYKKKRQIYRLEIKQFKSNFKTQLSCNYKKELSVNQYKLNNIALLNQ